jgi:hypothetical protein
LYCFDKSSLDQGSGIIQSIPAVHHAINSEVQARLTSGSNSCVTRVLKRQPMAANGVSFDRQSFASESSAL